MLWRGKGLWPGCGHVGMFAPSAAEVHRKAGTRFEDGEIYEWFGANVHRVHEPSMRQDVRARELKAAGMEWTGVLAVEAENKRQRLADELLASDAYGSTAKRVEALKQKEGGCRATFFIASRGLRRKGLDRGDYSTPIGELSKKLVWLKSSGYSYTDSVRSMNNARHSRDMMHGERHAFATDGRDR
jgi:hypothetical protein